MAVLIEYTGYKENMEFSLKYLKRQQIRVRGPGSVFTLDDGDNHERLISENPGSFRYAAEVEECEFCGKKFAPGKSLNTHKRSVHPEWKMPDGPGTRQNKTPWYKKRLSEIKMPNHGRRG